MELLLFAGPQETNNLRIHRICHGNSSAGGNCSYYANHIHYARLAFQHIRFNQSFIVLVAFLIIEQGLI